MNDSDPRNDVLGNSQDSPSGEGNEEIVLVEIGGTTRVTDTFGDRTATVTNEEDGSTEGTTEGDAEADDGERDEGYGDDAGESYDGGEG